ncbi:MAG: hypothetical protein JXA90_14065 [Planctomycetes bacterium]|nr:hypothetical protein [Planctomycetota bacterium]
MMIRRRLSLLLWLLALTRASWGQITPDTSFILRSVDEFSSLRRLLSDPASWSVLERASAKYAVWMVSTEAETSPAAGDAPEGAKDDRPVFLHHFDLAGRRGLSSKLYRISFRVEEPEGGELQITVLPERFVPRQEPFEHGLTLASAVDLVIFRALILDDVVAHQITAALEGRLVVSFRLRRDPLPPDIWEERTYEATFYLRETDGEEIAQLRYDVIYDPGRRRVTRIIIQQKEAWTGPHRKEEAGAG